MLKHSCLNLTGSRSAAAIPRQDVTQSIYKHLNNDDGDDVTGVAAAAGQSIMRLSTDSAGHRLRRTGE